ncbi:MAG: CapA family protein, partial [bacterium]|nr:CapA family protein [bacterium]
MKRLLILSWMIVILLNCSNSKHFVTVQSDPLHVFSFPNPPVCYRIQFEPAAILPSVTVVSVGDIMLGNHTVGYIKRYGVDYPFEATRSFLTGADLAFGNLEGPFTDSGEKFEKKYNFKIPPHHAVGLVNAGFDVVSLANNHILDYGEEGLINTISTLDNFEIAYCGAGFNLAHALKPALLESKGFKVAFLGF